MNNRDIDDAKFSLFFFFPKNFLKLRNLVEKLSF